MDYYHLLLGSGLLILGLTSAFNTLKFILTPLKKIEVANGNSSIYGVVTSEIGISAPITKTRCVYCVYRTFESGIRSGRKIGGTAQLVFGSGVKYSTFFLEDNTGKILVQAEKAPLYGTPHKLWLDDNTKEYAEGVSEFKLNTKIGEGNNREYEEDLVVPGDHIYVNGIVKTENGQRIIYADLISFKSIKKTGLSLTGIIVVLALIIFGIRNIIRAF